MGPPDPPRPTVPSGGGEPRRRALPRASRGTADPGIAGCPRPLDRGAGYGVRVGLPRPWDGAGPAAPAWKRLVTARGALSLHNTPSRPGKLGLAAPWVPVAGSSSRGGCLCPCVRGCEGVGEGKPAAGDCPRALVALQQQGCCLRDPHDHTCRRSARALATPGLGAAGPADPALCWYQRWTAQDKRGPGRHSPLTLQGRSWLLPVAECLQ